MQKLINPAVILAVLCALTGCKHEEEGQQQTSEMNQPAVEYHIDRASTVNLDIFYINCKEVELAVESMPAEDDSTVLYCAAAAYTAKEVKSIEGPYIHDGIAANEELFANLDENKGVFAFDGDSCYICSIGSHWDAWNRAEDNGGMAFVQDYIMQDGNMHDPQGRCNKDPIFYRCICIKKGRPCVIESRNPMMFADFCKSLRTNGVKNAIYTDMGGWSYRFFRDYENNVHPLLKQNENNTRQNGTNWIIFRK